MKKQKPVAEEKDAELKVFITSKDDSVCDECKEELGPHAWITLGKRGALCLACSDLDHLLFLRSGDAALTRRARKHSTLSAVVLKWSRARKRYERQGLLVEKEGLQKAEEECLADSEIRERRREREAERRNLLDREFLESFSARIREMFPGCPKKRARGIAEHACLKYSGRIGRSAAAKKFDEESIRVAVIAHIRHTETDYDLLLSRGYDRWDARDEVRDEIDQILEKWRSS
ncbi:MAG TPA: DUF2293 domain-containing protein [Thermodesulfobacteriota bacterium]|nr:DUF2293 domain-containing protein [Thermodesulfobacteriota bacterium]